MRASSSNAAVVAASMSLSPSAASDVTKLLGDRNDFRVEVEGEAETGGLWGEVAMEIRLAT